MSTENRIYYRERAKQEMAAAGRAASPSIGAIHVELAKLYEAKADGSVEKGYAYLVVKKGADHGVVVSLPKGGK